MADRVAGPARGNITIDGDECRGCGLCVESCPPKCLAGLAHLLRMTFVRESRALSLPGIDQAHTAAFEVMPVAGSQGSPVGAAEGRKRIEVRYRPALLAARAGDQ
jgi:ferredoxin